jgi:hypothetical protein
MRRNITAYLRQQVFLNYPYDETFRPFEAALTFGVVAAGLLPLCALDMSAPDVVRLDGLVSAIASCHYSAHDLSRSHGSGPENLARMNMPVEMGMALYHALSSQRHEHRCAFFVPSAHDYHTFVSDLAGLDPKCYNADSEQLVTCVYEWLRDVVPPAYLSAQPSAEVVAAFQEFISVHSKAALTGGHQHLGHAETREIMYRVCASRGWWDWRETRAGRDEFPEVPLQWREDPGSVGRPIDSLLKSVHQ